MNFIFTLSIQSSLAIGLAASATSKSPQVKTTEPMVSTTITNCGIQSWFILALDDFNYMGSRPVSSRGQKL